MKNIKIIWPVPSFVCPIRDIVVGPFDRDEVVELPKAVARLLVKKKRGRFIENPFGKWEVK